MKWNIKNIFEKLLEKLGVKLEDLEYYQNRNTIIKWVTVILIVNYGVTFLLNFFFDVTDADFKKIISFGDQDFPIINLIVALVFILLVITLILSLIGSDDKIKFGKTLTITALGSLICLVVASSFLLISISLPLYVSGGSMNSIFTTQIITLSTLSIIIYKPGAMRYFIIILSAMIYLFFMKFHLEITIKKQGFFNSLYFFMIVANLGITYFLGHKNKVKFDNNDPDTIEYYNERTELILIIAFVLALIIPLTLLVTYDSKIIELQNNFGYLIYNLSPKVVKVTYIIIYTFSLMTLLVAYRGSIKKRKIGPFTISTSLEKAKFYLIGTTILLLLFISLPIITTGGSIKSIYGPQLITLCSLSIIIANKAHIKLTLIGITLLLFFIFSNVHFDYKIGNNSGYNLLYSIMITINVAIALILSKDGKFYLFQEMQSIKDSEGNQNKVKLDNNQ